MNALASLPDTTKKIFLVVDDFEPMRRVTWNQLRSMGVRQILSANNGAEALRIMKHQQVDIVLSDWNMPVMSGFELLKEVRANAKLAQIPFLMITAEAERMHIEAAIAAGVDDLLVKPYTTNRLAERIERALLAPPRPFRPPPVTSLVAAENAVAIGAAPKVARPTLLIVDDASDNLLLLSELFKDEYRIRIANSGEKALAICQSDTLPDLVLLDIMLPGMDGFEVASRMRENPLSETIPVIFISAMTDELARCRGLELGAVDFISKPIEPLVLKPRVRNFMRFVALHRQLQANFDSMLELARLKSDVEHITRHDLKGPLAGVIGLVQNLAEEGNMNRRQNEQLQMIEETALQVLDMVNLSAELFKIETGRFTLDARPVKIDHILQRIIDISGATFEEKRLTFVLQINKDANKKTPQILGDATFCHSLFHNLVKNAAEAAPCGSEILVSMDDGGPLNINISIRNQGAVPQEIRTRFFGKFVTHGKEGGTGLGVYSARLLTQAQHGTIALEVADRADQTTITVSLPRYLSS